MLHMKTTQETQDMNPATKTQSSSKIAVLTAAFAFAAAVPAFAQSNPAPDRITELERRIAELEREKKQAGRSAAEVFTGTASNPKVGEPRPGYPLGGDTKRPSSVDAKIGGYASLAF